MSPPPVLVLVWFALSISCAVVGNLVFYLWLRSKGIEVRFFFAGTPGYLDQRYAEWCRQNGIRSGPILALRLFLVGNAIAAGLVFIGFMHD